MEQQLHRCPNCNRAVPANEWAAYRRHEDCAMKGHPIQTPAIPAALRSLMLLGGTRRSPRKTPT